MHIQLYIFVLGQLKIIQVAFGSETSLFSLSNIEPGKFWNLVFNKLTEEITNQLRMKIKHVDILYLFQLSSNRQEYTEGMHKCIYQSFLQIYSTKDKVFKEAFSGLTQIRIFWRQAPKTSQKLRNR